MVDFNALNGETTMLPPPNRCVYHCLIFDVKDIPYTLLDKITLRSI